MKKQKKPKIKSEWRRFSEALKKGNLPDNATTKALRKYFGVKGHPLKRSLRSKAAREEFNKLLTKYNKERMTKPSEARKRVDIRQKQLSTHLRNVGKERADYERRKYNKILYVLEAVADDIGSYITYQEAEALVEDNEAMTPKKIVDFIKNHYAKMQNELPDDAKDEEVSNKTFDDLHNLMTTFKTTNVNTLTKLINERMSNPYKFAKKEEAQKKKNKRAAATGRRGQRA